MMSSDSGNSSRSKYDDNKIIYTVIGAIHAVRCCFTSRDSIWTNDNGVCLFLIVI